MASAKAVPLLLRTARTATSARNISSYSSIPSPTICSFYRPSIINRLTPSTKRFYADNSRDQTALLIDALKPKSPTGATQTIIPSASTPTRSTVVPNPLSAIFQSTRGSEGLISPDQPLRQGDRRGRFPISGGIGSQRPLWSERATILDPMEQMFHLHIYSTKHNTHITFTDPKRNAVISCSTGILGFRKAGRHTYDSAYQLAGHVFQKIEEKGLIPKKVEVILRGWGVGREACVKALLGKEGRYIKDVIVRVTDATRTKFGGTRSKKPRRL